jgi:hypothetical protein
MTGNVSCVHRIGLGIAGASILSLTSCSLVLDWSGYTGGGAGGDAGTGAAAGGDGGDAASAEAGDAASVDAGAPLPACGPQSCGGCCDSTGCATGIAAETCGQGGVACQDCSSQGLACSGGMCVTAPQDSGPSTCSLIACKTLLTCLTSIDIACCMPDGTCGCESVFGPSSCTAAAVRDQ